MIIAVKCLIAVYRLLFHFCVRENKNNCRMQHWFDMSDTIQMLTDLSLLWVRGWAEVAAISSCDNTLDECRMERKLWEG